MTSRWPSGVLRRKMKQILAGKPKSASKQLEGSCILEQNDFAKTFVECRPRGPHWKDRRKDRRRPLEKVEGPKTKCWRLWLVIAEEIVLPNTQDLAQSPGCLRHCPQLPPAPGPNEVIFNTQDVSQAACSADGGVADTCPYLRSMDVLPEVRHFSL